LKKADKATNAGPLTAAASARTFESPKQRGGRRKEEGGRVVGDLREEEKGEKIGDEETIHKYECIRGKDKDTYNYNRTNLEGERQGRKEGRKEGRKANEKLSQGMGRTCS
jgi:hypothetical protein